MATRKPTVKIEVPTGAAGPPKGRRTRKTATHVEQTLPEDEPPAPTGVRPGLFPTDMPGVFRNKMNVLVDASGIALSFKEVRKRDAERFSEVLDGEVADTPAKLLKAVSLDPRAPMAVRIDAAKSAAPYFDRKQPTALDGGLDPNTGIARPLFDVTKLKSLSTAELRQLRELLAKSGAETK